MKPKAARRKSFRLPDVPGQRPLLSEQAAERVGVSLGTFYNLKSARKITPDLVYRGRPLFFESSLDRWRDEQLVVAGAAET
jgi:predicted DNA-binding protein (UPF0251 family)